MKFFYCNQLLYQKKEKRELTKNDYFSIISINFRFHEMVNSVKIFLIHSDESKKYLLILRKKVLKLCLKKCLKDMKILEMMRIKY